MRYTRGIRLKVSQWEKMAELPMGRIGLQRDNLVWQNESGETEIDLMEFNRRLLRGISTNDGDPVAKKTPMSPRNH